MDRDVWMLVMRSTRSLRSAAPVRRRAVRFNDRLILRLYLWLAWHDLPLCRVGDRAVYGAFFRPRTLPSVSQFCKRVREERFVGALEAVRRRLTGTVEGERLLCLDGKALPVTENTRDKEALTGHGGGKLCRGYRLHALADGRGRIVEYRVTDLREQEKNMAYEMLSCVGAGQVVLADGNYDSSRLYDAAAARGAFLFTPVREVGMHPRTIQRTSSARRVAGIAWRECRRMCEKAYSQRSAVERAFANLTNFAGGLRPLPPWVRTRRRVARWVAAKLVIYQARRLCRHPSAVA